MAFEAVHNTPHAGIAEGGLSAPPKVHPEHDATEARIRALSDELRQCTASLSMASTSTKALHGVRAGMNGVVQALHPTLRGSTFAVSNDGIAITLRRINEIEHELKILRGKLAVFKTHDGGDHVPQVH